MQTKILSVLFAAGAFIATATAVPQACTPPGGACTVGSSNCCLGATCEPHVAGRTAGACGH
ncbi:hypothetical protein CDEST_01871 [Colletotrichum destructivum]|uniref:Uncharacterized protein n=1 Tax=Colletotrichum destructivum TaxID=34406 RepID=A0AAX4I0C2_9PEZI|nr:hypothetical protein CDEST_01871 [Colletotrichum destructivum]